MWYSGIGFIAAVLRILPIGIAVTAWLYFTDVARGVTPTVPWQSVMILSIAVLGGYASGYAAAALEADRKDIARKSGGPLGRAIGFGILGLVLGGLLEIGRGAAGQPTAGWQTAMAIHVGIPFAFGLVTAYTERLIAPQK